MRLIPGSRARAALAHALGGAAVALAGCASGTAPQQQAVTHPAPPASSGTGLTSTQSTAKPTPKQRAEADAKSILAAFAVPPGVPHRFSADLSGMGGVVPRERVQPARRLRRARRAPAKVRKLITLINGLTFRVGPVTPALAVATATLSGCQRVNFSLGGKTRPTLQGVPGPQLLKITGLRWKIPVL